MSIKKKSIYKVTIHNADLTTVHFCADNQLGAIFKYNEYVKENYSPGFIDEKQDFDVEFVTCAYE